MRKKLAFWILEKLGFFPIDKELVQYLGPITLEKIGIKLVVFH